jgi:hypothetical protein
MSCDVITRRIPVKRTSPSFCGVKEVSRRCGRAPRGELTAKLLDTNRPGRSQKMPGCCGEGRRPLSRRALRYASTGGRPPAQHAARRAPAADPRAPRASAPARRASTRAASPCLRAHARPVGNVLGAGVTDEAGELVDGVVGTGRPASTIPRAYARVVTQRR